MKIAFYINVLSGGGAERVMANLASKFADDGHEVIMIVSFSTPNEYFLHSGVKRYILDDNNFRNAIQRNISRIKKLRQIIKHENPQVIISFMAEPNFRTILATRLLKTKVIVSVRNDPEKEYPSRLLKFAARSMYAAANGVVFQTPDAQKWFPKRIQEKSCIIYNPVNPVFFDKKLCDDRYDFVTAGRLTAQKNHSMLINAYKEIADKVKGNLIIYGEGEQRKQLEDLVQKLNLEDRVFLPGNTKNIVDCLSKALAFVLSSDYEGMPNALMEAMAMGLPCISTDCPCGGPALLIDDGKNGILIPVNDSDAMRIAMLEIDRDRQQRSLYEQNAKQTAAQFTVDRVCAKWLQLIEDITR